MENAVEVTYLLLLNDPERQHNCVCVTKVEAHASTQKFSLIFLDMSDIKGYGQAARNEAETIKHAITIGNETWRKGLAAVVW